MITPPILVLALLPAGLAVPAAAPVPVATHAIARAAAAAPEPTAAPELVFKRGLGDDIESYVGSLASDVESKVSTWVASGILDFPNGFPTGTEVQSSLGVSSSDIAAEPTQVLNIPPYANWTDDGWNVRVHGNVYKMPNISQSKLDDLANVFVVGKDVDELDDQGKAMARNVTRQIFVVQQGDEQVKMRFVQNVDVRPNATGGAINAAGGAQNITLPYNTTVEGDFDVFVKLRNTTGANGGHLIPGNATSQIQTLNVYAEGTDTGNATAYLVPNEGVTIVSDIDDILRVTKIYEPSAGLNNTFAKPFVPWANMPSVYANWSASLPNFHFHYLTTTPEQVTRSYMDFIYKTYPLGSFDTRPLNFSDVSATLSIRKFLLDKIFATFPQRKFILVADTSNSDVMKDYPKLYHEHPDQVLCILLRNTSATDPGDRFPYNTDGFKGIPQNHYLFFRTPDDLAHLDVVNGQCYNKSIPQNVTFDEQGLPFGLGDGGDDSAGATARASTFVLTAVSVAATALLVFGIY